MEELKQFEQTIEIQCYSERTKKSYKYHIKQFLKVYYNNIIQDNIPTHLYYLKTKRKYSPESLNLARASLFYFFNKILKKPITIDIPKVKRRKSLPRPINREIIIKLIDFTNNIKHKALIELAYSSGLRPFEALKLKWEDIDFKDKIVRVNNGKGGKDRFSLLSDDVVRHLLKLKKSKPEDNDYVFYSQSRIRTHICEKTMGKIFQNASKRAKLEKNVSPYTMRHSFCTHLLEDGTDIKYIQELAGHSSTKTTERYIKVAKQRLMAITSPLDNIRRSLNQNNLMSVERNVNTTI